MENFQSFFRGQQPRRHATTEALLSDNSMFESGDNRFHPNTSVMPHRSVDKRRGAQKTASAEHQRNNSRMADTQRETCQVSLISIKDPVFTPPMAPIIEPIAVGYCIAPYRVAWRQLGHEDSFSERATNIFVRHGTFPRIQR